MNLFSRFSLKQRISVLFVAIATLVALGGFAVSGTSSDLSLTMLDVGQGDAFLIRAPNGRTVLIDTGRDRKVVEELGRVMNGSRAIDVVLLTHPDADHIGGFDELLDHYSVGQVLRTGLSCDTEACSKVDALIEQRGIGDVRARVGQRVVLDAQQNIVLEVLFPFDVYKKDSSVDRNDTSIVVRLVFRDSEVMLTGDAPASVETALVRLGVSLQSDILKVGHHGSKTSTADVFLDIVDPQIALLSVGENNRYGHPHETVMEKLQQKNIDITSSVDGRVSLCTDGSGGWGPC